LIKRDRGRTKQPDDPVPRAAFLAGGPTDADWVIECLARTGVRRRFRIDEKNRLFAPQAKTPDAPGSAETLFS